MKELPDFLLTKKFDNYYLFLESEVLSNEFSSQLTTWIDILLTRHFVIELNILDEVRTELISTKFIVPSINVRTLEGFHKLQYKVNNDYLFFNIFDYWIRDSSLEWEGYISSSHEVCVWGCNNVVKHEFEELFQPYKKQKLDDKLLEYGSRFGDIDKTKEYMSELKKNYNL